MLGVINDDSMEGRVQVILVITGLGAPTLEEALMGVQKSVREPVAETFAPKQQAPLPITQAPTPVPLRQFTDLGINSQNMDIPAFLRRRARTAGPQTQQNP